MICWVEMFPWRTWTEQLPHEEIPKGIRSFNRSGLKIQLLIDHNRSGDDDGNDIFHPIVCTHLGETKALHREFDATEMMCIILTPSQLKFLKISDSFREGKNIINGRKWWAPPMVLEAEIHENYCSIIESNTEISDNEAYAEKFALNQEIEDSQNINLSSTLSIFFVHEPNKTLIITTDASDCDNILVNQENDSVLNIVRSWISNGKLPTKHVGTRQCKGLLGYANEFEKMFFDKETQIVCYKSEHSSKPVFLRRKAKIFHWSASMLHMSINCLLIQFLKRLSCLSNDFSFGLECTKGYEIEGKVAQPVERMNKSDKIKTQLPMRNGEKKYLTFLTWYILTINDLSTQRVLENTIVWW